MWDRWRQLRLPDLERRVPCDPLKVVVGSEHGEVMAQAQLRQQRADCPDLHAGASALIPQSRRLDVILAIRCHQRQRGKPFNNAVAAFWARESLQQFLQYK